MREIAHIGPAIVLGNRDAVQAECTHRRPEGTGKAILPVDLVCQRRNPVLGEPPNTVAQGGDLLPEIDVEDCREVLAHGLTPPPDG